MVSKQTNPINIENKIFSSFKYKGKGFSTNEKHS